MNRVLQIANYVIHVALDQGIDITNLHLQKILYYLQAESLVRSDVPLFDGEMEKWRLGPVIPTVYHEYKEFGSRPIAEIATEIVFDSETMDIDFVEFNEDDIEDWVRGEIQPLIIELLHCNPFDLVDKTHEHTPWSDLRDRIESGERGLVYTNEEIQNYFTLNPEKLTEVLGGVRSYGSNS